MFLSSRRPNHNSKNNFQRLVAQTYDDIPPGNKSLSLIDIYESGQVDRNLYLLAGLITEINIALFLI